jgi:polysaccharide deacetylase family protein (PEP-CTERM system associated)
MNVFSVDVEEHSHAHFYQVATQGLPGAWRTSRVERNVDRLLGILADRHVRGTFFVLGEVALCHPAMVQRIAAAGHEVASHGFAHVRVSEQAPAAFREDVRRSKGTLEGLTGSGVLGYRAPNFSIDQAHAWAYGILADEGFRYDSSTYPVRHDHYGDPDAPRRPHPIAETDGRLIEFPIGTARPWGGNLPIGGGGYFRLLPLSVIRCGIWYANRREGQPVMFFLHPWEIDAEQPRPPMDPYHRFRLYVGVRTAAQRLDQLLSHVPFDTAQAVLGLDASPCRRRTTQGTGR